MFFERSEILTELVSNIVFGSFSQDNAVLSSSHLASYCHLKSLYQSVKSLLAKTIKPIDNKMLDFFIYSLSSGSFIRSHKIYFNADSNLLTDRRQAVPAAQTNV
mgnify:CR=1 FL=1